MPLEELGRVKIKYGISEDSREPRREKNEAFIIDGR